MISLDAMPVPLANNKGFGWVDAIDHAAVLDRSWIRNYRPDNGRTPYAQTSITTERCRTTIALHVFVARRAGIVGSSQVDHIDGLNCTRENLRAATPGQNIANRPAYRANKSGFKGVTWHEKTRSWRAEIVIRGRKTSLGCFPDPLAAARVYDQWARQLWGSYACPNLPEFI